MSCRVMTLIGGLFLGLLTVVAGFMLGMRARSPWLLNGVRRFNRAVSTRADGVGGHPGAYASLIRHTVRMSGGAYASPVGAVATEDGFVDALVYGWNTDWLQNVLASGSATLVHKGRTYEVDQPEIVPITAARPICQPATGNSTGGSASTTASASGGSSRERPLSTRLAVL
jgi:hypothetical protein